MDNPTITTIKASKNPIKGYKVFKRDEKGRIYTDGYGNANPLYWRYKQTRRLNIPVDELFLCRRGFHFFFDLVFAATFDPQYTVIREVTVIGDVKHDTYKAVTNQLTVGRKISKQKLNKVMCNSRYHNSANYNSGSYNSGHHNAGDRNSGYRNTGDHNSGHHNAGNCNSGRYNSGRYNSGDHNSGRYNSGDHNSGHHNAGDRNSGCYNSGRYNSGRYNAGNCNSGRYNSGHYNAGDYNSSNGYINLFCTTTKYFLFDVEVEYIPKEILGLDMSWFTLIDECAPSTSEALSTSSYRDAWSKCPKKVLDTLRSIPEFQKPENKKKFYFITGIKL